MNKRRKFLAIVMSMVALGTGVFNHVSRANDRANGVQTDVRYWNEANNNCASCTLIGEANCSPTTFGDLCMCTVSPGNNQLARIETTGPGSPEDNCVQLRRPAAIN